MNSIINTMWKHIKTDEIYVIDDEVVMQASTKGEELDEAAVIIYKSIKTGEKFVRLKEEFLDGRFKKYEELKSARLILHRQYYWDNLNDLDRDISDITDDPEIERDLLSGGHLNVIVRWVSGKITGDK